MMERLQKWRTEKGKPPPAATKRPASSGATNKKSASHAALGRDRKPGGVGVKKPLCTANYAKNMTVKTAQKKQSLKKRGSVEAIKGNHAAMNQPELPDMPMSKKLALWRAQKEKEASTHKKSATKRPWRGSGTPLVNPSKRVAKQTLATVSQQHEMNSSTQKRRSCTLPTAQSSSTTIEQHPEPVDQDCSDMVLPTRLTFSPPSKTLHDSTDAQSEQIAEQASHGSESGQPFNSSLCSNPDSSSVETEQDLVVDGLQHTESEQVSVEEDECDFMLHSTLETITDEKQRRVSNLATSKKKSSRKSQTPGGKRSVCKSAMKQVNRVGGALTGEPRSVKFTTPVRCSPCLAKVGEGAIATPASNTPKNKGDMRDRLQQWLQEKGKTPSRYSHLLNFQRNTPADRLTRERRISHKSTPVTYNQSSNEEAEEGLSTQAEEKLNATLDVCLTLLHEGCPVNHVNNWLDDICRRLPMVEQCAKYWLCRATATELDGADYHDVVGVFEEAAEAGAQPVDEIKEALKEFVMRMGQEDKEDNQDEEEDEDTPVSTPMAVMQSHTPAELQETPEVLAAERDTSSVVQPTSLSQHSGLKYCLTDTTPLFKRTNSRAATPYYTPGLMITLVRRSVRLEKRRSFLPDNLKDHDVCVNSLQDLPSDAPTEFILRYNRALEDEFDDDDAQA